MLDAHCVRAVDPAGIAETIEWWAAHGEARVNRAHRSLRVVPPLLHGALENYWAFVCSCRRRRAGDVAGGFALIRGDGSRVHWYRPPDSATLTMLSVLLAEALVFAHMFMYCRCGGGRQEGRARLCEPPPALLPSRSPAVDALTHGAPSFEGSCLTSSTFLYVTALLPLALVVLQARRGGAVPTGL